MGLDMYLYKRTYVKNYDFMGEDERHEITVKKGGEVSKDIKPERISHIVEEVGYWRKANEIHAWFVRNVQDGVDNCQEYYVSTEKLKQLLNLVNRVLRHGKQGPVLLPTQSGFFFGGTDYDEYYFEDLKHTKEVLETALKEDGDYYYQSSW